MKHARQSRGYTIGELLGVMVIVAVLSMVAYPAIRALTASSRDAGIAGDVAGIFNRAKDQARRRNRAVVVRFRDFNRNEPRGKIEAREATASGCGAIADDVEGKTTLFAEIPFGGTLGPNNTTAEDTLVGLLGWTINNGGNQAAPLEVCVNPKGSIWQISENAARPVDGLSVWIQRFDAQNDALSLPRAVDFNFATGARLRM
ncbi:hypothetical protein KKF91_07635 [Myxococcota bacterium]|nr:hypothetical protein [Myxococcota bacterium]MBU1430414.1 hypothetical protein [Myxococcota bacterium]MBU1897806.1 hypothetical protein [Myxococcota bacterium]